MYGLFLCKKCNHVDSYDITKGEEPICTKCVTGVWHDVFEYEEYDPEKHDALIHASRGDMGLE